MHKRLKRVEKLLHKALEAQDPGSKPHGQISESLDILFEIFEEFDDRNRRRRESLRKSWTKEMRQKISKAQKKSWTPERREAHSKAISDHWKESRDSYALEFVDRSGQSYLVEGWDNIEKESGMKKGTILAYLVPSSKKLPQFTDQHGEIITIRRPEKNI